MREIKAIVRVGRLEEVVRALESSGAPGVTVSTVHGLGYGYDPLLFTLGRSELQATWQVAKVEVVCREEDVARLVDAVVRAARTGSSGDGIVFVSPVERVVKVRTGGEGPASVLGGNLAS